MCAGGTGGFDELVALALPVMHYDPCQESDDFETVLRQCFLVLRRDFATLGSVEAWSVVGEKDVWLVTPETNI